MAEEIAGPSRDGADSWPARKVSEADNEPQLKGSLRGENAEGFDRQLRVCPEAFSVSAWTLLDRTRPDAQLLAMAGKLSGWKVKSTEAPRLGEAGR